jgi:hypothetical protein
MKEGSAMKWTLEYLSRGAALLASVAGIVTLLQFNRGQDFEKEKLALEMFRDYSKDKREFDSNKAPSDADIRAFAVTTQYAAETIYRFRSGNPGWEETVMGMIKDNESALLAVKEWHCRAMDLKYYCAMQKALEGRLDCDAAPTCP